MTAVYLLELNDENRKAAFEIALSMYLGETCPYCKIMFTTVEQLNEAVWNGYTDYGRIAHKSCWNATHLAPPPEAE